MYINYSLHFAVHNCCFSFSVISPHFLTAATMAIYVLHSPSTIEMQLVRG